MPRISDQELQRIKSQATVEDVCRFLYGIELNGTGPDNLVGRCPLHHDHTPTLFVDPAKNLWNCLDGCGGDVIELVIRIEELTYKQAVERLQALDLIMRQEKVTFRRAVELQRQE